jgi:MFS family permease
MIYGTLSDRYGRLAILRVGFPLYIGGGIAAAFAPNLTTKMGLEVEVTILDHVYETGRKVAAHVKEQMRVIFDDKLPQWNYRIPPGNIPTGETI